MLLRKKIIEPQTNTLSMLSESIGIISQNKIKYYAHSEIH